MAATSKYKKLFSLFRSNVETGVNLGDQVYNLPLVLRKDGSEFRVGQAVRRLPRPSSCPEEKPSSSNSCDKKQSSSCQEISQNLSNCQEISEQLSPSSSSCQEKLSVSLGSCHRDPQQQLFLIKEILLSGDLGTVTLVLNPVEVSLDGVVGRVLGEMVLADLASVILDTERIISEDLARDGMRKVIAGIGSYPEFVQRCVRKHQLAAQLRSSVHLFLSGSSLSRSVSLGDVDWRLDPGILGLDRETDYTLEYRIEQYSGPEYVSCHLDLLLGRGWDVRGVGGGGGPNGEHCLGYRVILTLELRVDMKHQLRLDTHAITCRGNISPLMDNCSYRHACVTQTGTLHLTCPDIMESMHSARGVSLDWEEFQEDSFKLTSGPSHLTEEDMQMSPCSVEDVIREIEGCSFPDTPRELFGGREIVLQQNDDEEQSPGAQGEIEETSTALKKLLTTPTKGFSQLVFNESISQSEVNNKQAYVGDEDEELMPNLSPIKFYQNDQRRFESLDHSLSDDPVSRQTTSTPEYDISSDSIEDIKDENVNGLDTVNEKLCDRENQSKNNNVISSSINVDKSDEGSEPENLIKTLSVSSKVEAYVQSLPEKSSSRSQKHNKTVLDSSCESAVCNSTDQSEACRTQADQPEASLKALGQSEAAGSRPRHDNTVLDESFESEASSMSRLSSRQSDLLTSLRYNNSGMFYGSALGGQTVCPFPSEWQYQTVPETINNDEEID